MNLELRKAKICEYASSILEPLTVEEVSYEEENIEEGVDIWTILCDSMEEFWAIEGEGGIRLFRKAGLYQNLKQVLEAYEDMLQEDERTQIPDRFQF